MVVINVEIYKFKKERKIRRFILVMILFVLSIAGCFGVTHAKPNNQEIKLGAFVSAEDILKEVSNEVEKPE